MNGIGFTNNQLKILAIIAMLSDHIGRELLPQYPILTFFGRLSFPIFAYMIAEGCRYTKNKKKYLLMILGLGLLCQVVFFITTGSLYQCVLITFSLSIVMIYTLDYLQKEQTLKAALLLLTTAALVIFLCAFLPEMTTTDFWIDYGLIGVMLPVTIYLMPNKTYKLIGTTIMLVLLAYAMGGQQWFALITVPLLALYNGKRGTANLKYLFYIFYPSHLVIIYAIQLLIAK